MKIERNRLSRSLSVSVLDLYVTRYTYSFIQIAPYFPFYILHFPFYKVPNLVDFKKL